MRRRHRYVTVIVNGDTGRTLAMVAHRGAAALSGFLVAQRRSWCEGVRVVVSDGSRSYRSAIDTHLGHARRALDRFHAIRWFSAALTAARRDIQRREPQGVKPVSEPEVFQTGFALPRRDDTLTQADRARLEALLDAHPRLRAARQARQQLHGHYPAADRHGALAALGRSCDLYETRDLPEFPNVVDTTIASSTETLESPWHHTGRASNRRIEGTNNLLQVLRRTAHGFTNPTNLEAHGILVTQSPQPEPAPFIPRLREGPTCVPAPK